MRKTIKTRWPTRADLDVVIIGHITHMVNDIYDEAEKGIWKVKASRTTSEEIRRLLENKQLILATQNQQIVGCIQLVPHDEKTMEFGMLAVDDNHRGAGIGVTLIRAVEQYARKEGFIAMQLDLLEPTGWQHPGKERLKRWYKDSGYSPQTTRSFAAEHPEKAHMLATECDFTRWTKSLAISKQR